MSMYAVTDKNGVASFDDVLISGTTPYTIEEVDTAIRYVVPANQTAPINWKEVTTRNFTNILKKFSVTVTKSDREEGTPQGDATLAGAVYDEVGSPDEQHQELGTGNREESGNIRLEYYDRNHEDKSLPFFGGDDTIREILGTTPHLSASKEEIKDFYERNTDNATRTEYIKGIFNNDYTRLTLNDGRLVGYKTFQNVLHLWEGEYHKH